MTKTFIPYGQQNISPKDIEQVVNVLNSSHLTQGKAVSLFENKLASHCDAKHAVSFCNATAALHSACLSLDIKKGDNVWTSPISFVASANCVLYCNATIDFVDIDLNTANICPKALATKLHNIKNKNDLPKAIIVVHMAGQSADMQEISRLCNEYNIRIIEDASHAIGGKYENKKIGSCQYSDITIFSFHPVKIITTGEGGAALSNDPKLVDKLKLYRSHGITNNSMTMSQNDGPWYYQQIALGHNYRMTDIQAALGYSQLDRLSSFISQRQEIARIYDKAFQGSEWRPLRQLENCSSAYHLYIIKNNKISKLNKLETFEKLRAIGIQVHIHYIPIHTQPYYKSLGFYQGQYPNAELYYEQAISIPMYPHITTEQQNFVINSILTT